MVVTRSPNTLTAVEIDAMAAVIQEVGKRVGTRLLLVQVSQLTGGVSIHYASPRDSVTAFGRFASAMREHVEEVHGIASVGGPLGSLMRGVLKTITRFGPNPSILHADVDALVEHLRASHGVDPAALRACIARVTT